MYLFFWLHWIFAAVQAFSSSASGLYSLVVCWFLTAVKQAFWLLLLPTTGSVGVAVLLQGMWGPLDQGSNLCLTGGQADCISAIRGSP